jgi:cobalt/nickel transport system permease protein
VRNYVIALALLAILTPLGLLAEGTAWGEWAPESLVQMTGFIPEGMKQAGIALPSIMPDYSVKGLSEGMGYLLSAVIGAIVIFLSTWGYVKILSLRTKS